MLPVGRGLAALPLAELVRNAAVLHGCASPTLVRAGSAVLTASLRTRLAAPLLAAVKATVFRQFVAGEALSDVRAVASRYGQVGVRCIVDHVIEESTAAEARQRNLDNRLRMLRTLREELPDACAFVPVKPTSLVPPAVLEKLTKGAAAVDVAEGDALDRAVEAARLEPAEAAQLELAGGALRRLCEGGASAGIPLLIDAEQSHRQPAIQLLTRELSREFNGGDASRAPVVYHTHQAYLRGSTRRLEIELADAAANGYTLAVKLVRGAYLGLEQLRGGGVLQLGKLETDASYDECAQLLLSAICRSESGGRGERGGGGGAALMLATHNRDSSERVVAELARRRLGASHPRVHFAQIKGMADDLTLSLALGGHNALKLVPFGAVGDVLPWMLRRLEENQDALGQAAIERPLLRAELLRRFTAARPDL